MTHSQHLEKLYKVSAKQSNNCTSSPYYLERELCVSEDATSQHMRCFWVLLKYKFLNSTERSVTVDYFTIFHY